MVFDKQWFEKHQSKLLFFANNFILKYWFRWILRIHKDIPFGTKIYKLEPNCFTWQTGKPDEFTTDFRTHNKFSKRLYYAFKWFWYLLHFWDYLTSPIPELNFGFDTLTVYPDAHPETTSVDGYTSKTGTNATWTSLRDASTATTASDNEGTTGTSPCRIQAGTTSNTWNAVSRSAFLFDTSSLTTSASISSAVMSLYGTSTKVTTLTDSLDIVASSPASNTAIATSDFPNYGTTSFSNMAISSWSDTAYNGFTLDSNGRSNISLTSVSKFGIRCHSDMVNTPPTWVSGGNARIYTYFSSMTGTTNDPKLVVTYTTGGVTFTPQTIIIN